MHIHRFVSRNLFTSFSLFDGIKQRIQSSPENMNQEQPRRPQHDQDPIKYGDVFDVHGELATKPILPKDAETMQAAENQVRGETPRGGPSSVMQSAAIFNVRTGLVDPEEPSDVVRNQGMAVSDKSFGGDRVITETIGGQVVAKYIEPTVPMTAPGLALERDAMTIGEALEATALSAAGDKPVDQSDAAAIQAAEVRATGTEILQGGVAAQAQSAAIRNSRARHKEDKITLSDVLGDSTLKLPADKVATREDAEGVIEAEVRNKPNTCITRGGVADSVAAAVRLNQNTKF